MERHVPIRDLSFDLSEVPKAWLGGRRAVTLFYDNLSIFFPVGERFFLTSVKRYLPKLEEPRLRAEVRGFLGQEAIHGREHVRYNQMSEDKGYPVKAMERDVERLLSLVSRALPWRAQLGVTCALEHFTALMGQLILSDPRFLEGAHPTMAALWRWHALEENEHKAVAFDVYKAVGGPALERIIIMLFATLIFWAMVLKQQLQLMRAAGLLLHLGEWADLLKTLLLRPGLLPKLTGPYLAYYRPGFHPWAEGDEAKLEAWQKLLNPPADRSAQPGAGEPGWASLSSSA